MMATSSEVDISREIYNATNSCRVSLQGCQSIKPLMVDGWAENRLADFDLWASGVALPGSGKESLEVPSSHDGESASGEGSHPHEVETQQNTGSASAWFDALSSDSEDDGSSSTTTSDDDAESTQSAPIKDVMQGTEDLLDQIIRLGFAIRKSGTTSRLRRADKSFREEDHQDLKAHLALALALNAGKQCDNRTKTTAERVPDPQKSYDQLMPEQRQLIIANLRRRHRFLYARRHQKKLEEPPELNIFQETKPIIQAVEFPESAAQIQGPRPLAKTSEPKQPSMSAPITPAKSMITISTIQGDILKAAAPSQIKHLTEDLCPYTCPFSDCSSMDTLYITRKAWKDHIDKDHGSSQHWQCLACKGVTTSDIFLDVETFTNHIKTDHQDTMAESQIPTLLDVCCIRVPPNIPSCPLCLSTQEQADCTSPAAMLDHVGDCIHEFSLRALPWAQSVSEWLGGIQWADIDEKSLALRFLSVESPSTTLDDAYAVGEYFAEISENSSQVAREPPSSGSDLPAPSFGSASDTPRVSQEDLDRMETFYSRIRSRVFPYRRHLSPRDFKPHVPRVGSTSAWRRDPRERPDPPGEFPVLAAIKNVENELEHGSDEPQDENQDAAEQEQSLDAKALHGGYTPSSSLLFAARSGNFKYAKELIETGKADVNTCNSGHETPLSLAAGYGFGAVTELLLRSGANVEVRDMFGRTPLSLAVGFGDLAITELLLVYNANVDARDHLGRTPLWMATLNSDRDIAGVLLDKGADMNIKNNEGQSLLQIAKRHPEFNEFLIARGGDPEAISK
ncbi:hypothetical protein CEP52_005210 [Fusarium oligoseptatum]|uniref:Uncharacterized protein n=1 Tax=Fusarium oligoseptatum TaxID=2604345 RepID=A0A428TZH4_9HYPO|nr:hypothetical protein CEP52_005210 [Fusarium oligoseptatum]